MNKNANSSRVIIKKSHTRVDSIMTRETAPKFQLIQKKDKRPKTSQSRRSNFSHLSISKALLDKFDEGTQEESKGLSKLTNYSQETLKDFSTLLKYYPENLISINS